MILHFMKMDLPMLSKKMPININSIDRYTDFHNLQNLCFEGVKEIAQTLKEGDSEIAVALRLKQWMQAKGVRRFFHEPFVWFSDRAAFHNFSMPFSLKVPFAKKGESWHMKLPSPQEWLPHFGREFAPTDKILSDSTAIILDVAPIIDDVSVDIGYSYFWKNPNSKESSGDLELAFNEGREFLKNLRTKIPQLLAEYEDASRVYLKINDYLENHNYENRHQFYPGHVLGHRLDLLQTPSLLPKINFMGFGLEAYYELGTKILKGLPRKSSPLWNHYHVGKLENGLWAVEPHIQITTKDHQILGLKFEEILVVNGGSYYWLENSLVW
jgi:hypothetical protein